MEVVDDNGLPVPTGEIGELVCRPKLPSIMMDGYLNKPEETLRTTEELWFHCGDYVRRDAEGYFYFSGRKKERIRRRGENISGFEVERIIGMHPDISRGRGGRIPCRGRRGRYPLRHHPAQRRGARAGRADGLAAAAHAVLHVAALHRIRGRHAAHAVREDREVQAGRGRAFGAAWDREKAGYRIERNTPKSAKA